MLMALPTYAPMVVSNKRIANARTPRELADVLVESNLSAIGVHLFYQRYALNSPARNNYLHYEKRVLELLKLLPIQYKNERLILVAETYSGMLSANGLLTGNIRTPDTPNFRFFISPDGQLNYPCLPVGNPTLLEMAAFNINTETHPTFIKIANEGSVFVFGLYSDNCVPYTKGSLREIAASNIPSELQIFENQLFTLSSNRQFQ